MYPRHPPSLAVSRTPALSLNSSTVISVIKHHKVGTQRSITAGAIRGEVTSTCEGWG